MSKLIKNEFSARTIKILSARAAQTCSNPECLRPTSGPHSDTNKSTVIGKAAHISGRKPGSARFDCSISEDGRKDISNAIWLCGVCHDLVDKDEKHYPVELLHSWKIQHERKIQGAMVRNINFGKIYSSSTEVISEENASDKSRYDIYLINNETGEKKFYITLSDIFSAHYHGGEYIEDNLYIIHRTGGSEGYEKNPSWTDQLWRYTRDKPAVKIYDARGLDFMVSEDNLYIALIYASLKKGKEEIIIMNNDGKILKKIGQKEFGKIKMGAWKSTELAPSPLIWLEHTFWFTSNFGPNVFNLSSIDAKTGKFTVFKLPRSFDMRDMSFNPSNGKIAYSDFPTFFAAEDYEEYKESSSKVYLRIFDILSGVEKTISKSTAKEFKPKWNDDNTLEYDDPGSKNRLIKVIAN